MEEAPPLTASVVIRRCVRERGFERARVRLLHVVPGICWFACAYTVLDLVLVPTSTTTSVPGTVPVYTQVHVVFRMLLSLQVL